MTEKVSKSKAFEKFVKFSKNPIENMHLTFKKIWKYLKSNNTLKQPIASFIKELWVILFSLKSGQILKLYTYKENGNKFKNLRSIIHNGNGLKKFIKGVSAWIPNNLIEKMRFHI